LITESTFKEFILLFENLSSRIYYFQKNPQWGKFNKKGRTSKRETDLYTLNLQED